MPSTTRNSNGVRSMNELFAMKKNQAFDTKLSERMESMSQDFYSRRETLKQDIRDVYHDLQDIRLSTGYCLEPDRAPSRVNSVAKIYLPPIGLRLVKKYVGVDFKRTSIAELSGDKRLEMFSSALNLHRPSFPEYAPPPASHKGILKTEDIDNMTCENEPADNQFSSQEEHSSNEHTDNAEIRNISAEERSANQDKPTEVMDSELIQALGETESSSDKLLWQRRNVETMVPMLIQNERAQDEPTDESPGNKDHALIQRDDDLQKESTKSAQDIQQVENQAFNPPELVYESTEKVDDATTGQDGRSDQKSDPSERVHIETRYNLTERRSSRSTFRARSSVRLPSQGTFLSEHNMEVIGLKSPNDKKKIKRAKFSREHDKIGNFYIDYGDGVLHDNSEIPRIKDCSRPWCNPHCKTCKKRSIGGPCFVLIPVDENTRRSKLPADKRRLSMFPVYKAAVNTTKLTQEEQDAMKRMDFDNDKVCQNGEDVHNKENPKESESKDPENRNENANKDCIHEDTEVKHVDEHNNIDEIPDADEETFSTEIRKLIMENKAKKQKQGYSRKRIEELSQPRGGPPAEVRFSKMSLRKKQDQMKEFERLKELSKREQENLTYIQGKISVFCALLNEHELTGKPTNIRDLPVLGRHGNRKKSGSGTKRSKNSKSRKNVVFSPVAPP